jgi:hypothetical protein
MIASRFPAFDPALRVLGFTITGCAGVATCSPVQDVAQEDMNYFARLTDQLAFFVCVLG